MQTPLKTSLSEDLLRSLSLQSWVGHDFEFKNQNEFFLRGSKNYFKIIIYPIILIFIVMFSKSFSKILYWIIVHKWIGFTSEFYVGITKKLGHSLESPVTTPRCWLNVSGKGSLKWEKHRFFIFHYLQSGAID